MILKIILTIINKLYVNIRHMQVAFWLFSYLQKLILSFFVLKLYIIII